MSRLLILLLSSSTLATMMSSCKVDNNSKKVIYPSREDANLACKSWQKKGGTWSLKVNDFRISAIDKQIAPSFPITVESTKNNIEEDLNLSNNDAGLTVYLPLLSSGEGRIQKNKGYIMTTIGDKWLVYDRRICSISSTPENIILGKQYLVKPNSKVLDSSLPSLTTNKRFSFKK